MGRLTIKDDSETEVMLNPDITLIGALQKLKKLEDIEEEFGIDLTTYFKKKKKIKDLTVSEIFNICKNQEPCKKCPLFLKDNIYNVNYCLKTYIHYGNLPEEVGNIEIEIKEKKNKKNK